MLTIGERFNNLCTLFNVSVESRLARSIPSSDQQDTAPPGQEPPIRGPTSKANGSPLIPASRRDQSTLGLPTALFFRRTIKEIIYLSLSTLALARRGAKRGGVGLIASSLTEGIDQNGLVSSC